ncbi:MAG: FMN-binding protein [Erysipelotrichia bacterium]|nr:FMN-binding protein [Erysipelotrichia bacterium]
MGKKLLKIMGVFLMVVCLLVVGIMVAMGRKVAAAEANQVNVPIDLQQVVDGSYSGSSDGGMVQVEVQVTVKDHQITSIDLLRHDCGTGKPAEAILDTMVAENTDDVDAVSGATLSSKTIRNAVNVALQQGLAD